MICTKPELRRSRFHGEWCRPNNIGHAVPGIAFRDGVRSGLVGFIRLRYGTAFREADLALVPVLLPHLARAYARTGTCRQAELADLVGQIASTAGDG